MRPTSLLSAIIALTARSGTVHAQRAETTRNIGRLEARAEYLLHFQPMIAELPDGRVVVAEGGRWGRLLLLDSTLRVISVIADSTPKADRAPRFDGRSVLFTSGTQLFYANGHEPTLRAVEPSGVIGRSIPMRLPDAMANVFSIQRPSAMDRSGRILFVERSPTDAAALMAVDPTSGLVTAIGRLKQELPDFAPSPLPVSDDWAVLFDGTVAILGGASGSIEWIRPDGTRTRTTPSRSTPLSLSPADRQRMVDSARAWREAFIDSNPPLRSLIRRVTLPLPAELPSTLPPYVENTAVAGPGNTLWVAERRRYAVGDSVVWMVIARGGDVAYRVKIPPDVRIIGFGARTIYGCIRKEIIGGNYGCRLVRLSIS